MKSLIFEISNFHGFYGEIPYKWGKNVAQIPFFYANIFFGTRVFFSTPGILNSRTFFPANANLIVLDCEPPHYRLAHIWSMAGPDEILKMQLLKPTAAESDIGAFCTP